MPPIRTDKRVARHDPIVEQDNDYDSDDEFPNPIFGGKNHPGVHIWKINPVEARRHKKKPITFRTTIDYYGVSGYVLEEEESTTEDKPVASGSGKGKERDPGGGIPVAGLPNPQQMQSNYKLTNENYQMLERLRQHLDSLYSGLGIEVARDSSGLVTGWTSGPKTIEIFAVGPQIVQQLANAVGGLHHLATVGLIRRCPNGSIMVLPKCPGNIIESIAGSPRADSSRGSSESAPVFATNTGIRGLVWPPAGLATGTQNIQEYPQTVPITSTNEQWPAQVGQGYQGYMPTEPTTGYGALASNGLAQHTYGYSQAGPSWAGSTAHYPSGAPGMNACYGGALMSAGPVWPTQGYHPMQSNPWVNTGCGALSGVGPTQPIQPMQAYLTVPVSGTNAGYVTPPSMALLDPAMGPTPPMQPVQGYPVAPTPQMNAGYVAPVPMAPLDPAQGNTGWDYSGMNVGDGAQSEMAPTEPQATDASCTNEPQPIEFDWDFFENYLKTLTPKMESFL